MKYAWKRFWCPREGVLNLSDAGFLIDPEAEYARFTRSDVVPFDAIAQLPCVAMLGEPGIGKSTAIEDIRGALLASLLTAGEELVYTNLNEYGDESRLIRDVFESASLRNWEAGNHRLHLFLDSLDECRLRIPQVAAIIVNRLKQVSPHLSRLRLRVACRTADWPGALENGLRELWGKDGYCAFELAPLRREDVEAAARAEEIDSDRFLAELARTEAVPLAIKPVTLTFLLSAFKAHGRLPSSRRELYEAGCTMLCEELNLNRRDQNETGWLTAKERVAIASRIAAVSILCRRPCIDTGPTPAQQVTEDAPVSAFVGNEEPAGSGHVPVDDGAVREVLATGLFSSRGHLRMGFAHQTYAEFLAARFLLSHPLDTQKILALLCHPDDPGGHVVPQLYETAAWTASGNRDVLHALAERDPQVLLRGDAGSLTDQDRRLVVDSLLRALDARRANDRGWGLRLQYAKLNHSGLADQLRPWLTDKTRHWAARDAAISIAEACELTAVESILADVALDQTELLRVRDLAAHAVAEIASPDTRLRLRPLAFGQAGDDPADQLKGNALRGLWPGLLSAEELFQCLTLPKQRNFHGAYAGFVELELAETLRPEDLSHAIGWLKSLVGTRRLAFGLYRFCDEVIVKAWQHMEDPAVLEALAEMGAECFRHHMGLLRGNEAIKDHAELFDDNVHRRRLAARIMDLPQDRDTPIQLTYQSPPLVRREDLEWCVERLKASVGLANESHWAELTWYVFGPARPDSLRLDSIIAARLNSPRLREQSDLFFQPVALDSERAAKMQKEYRDSLEHQHTREAQVLDPPPRDRVAECLDRCERGQPFAWCWLLDQMTIENTSTHYGHVPSDVRGLPGWQMADQATRARILDAADRFLRVGPVDSLKWLREPHTWGNFHTAPYAAMLLLKNEAPALFSALPSWVWERHTATVLCMPPFDNESVPKSQHDEIALTCYQQAPHSVLFYLPIQLDAEDRAERHISCDRKLSLCWDDTLKTTIHSKLVEAQPYWKVETFDHVAARLMEQGWEDTRDVLVEHVRSVAEGVCENLDRARNAAAGLIKYSHDAAWSVVWPAAMANREFGRKLLMSVAHGLRHRADPVASKLPERELADLYVWLAKEFPFAEDRQHDEAYSPTQDDSARDFRDGVLRCLEAKGSPASVLALEQVARSLPQYDWLQTVVIEARRNALRKTWDPCSPDDLLALARNPHTRLVRSAKQLQEALVDALSALEGKLQGETPAAPDLWDQTVPGRKEGRFRPKDENHLSDWVKRNLEPELAGHGIVMAREVQIRRGEGLGKGETTDIHVTALVPGLPEGTWDSVKVIIETKGCWHKELTTAMKIQLVGRYLKGNTCRNGIYLVGWYCCEQWDDDDYRKQDVPRWSIEEARTFLDDQARSLSQGEVTIRSVVINAALR